MNVSKNAAAARSETLHKIICQSDIDAVLFFNINNIRYLTGFTGSEAMLIAGKNEALLFVDGRYITQAGKQVKNAAVIEFKDKAVIIADTIKKNGLKKIGLEAAAISLQFYHQLIKKIPAKFFRTLGDELKLLRAVKDEDEIKLMKKAAVISSAAVLSLADKIKAGVMERDLALEFEFNVRRAGAEQLSFATIIAAGENSALPHAQPSGRKIKKGDLIVIDFGVKYQGYCSDETCTFAFGGLTDKQRNAYQAVKEAHDLAIAGVQAGVSAAAIDLHARDVLRKNKLDRYFVHSTGHGVGMDVHEPPRLAENSPDVLDKGMVITIEPGVYFAGQWGIRIEDMVLVKNNGCEILSKLDKELTVIE